MNRLFLDASFTLALASSADHHHARATELAIQIEENRPALVTTRAVVLEIGNALAKRAYRTYATMLLRAIERDSRIEIVPLSEELFAKTLEFYVRHQDKEWGLTDCLSFVVMRENGINEALTTDNHFRQAGFQALLL